MGIDKIDFSLQTDYMKRKHIVHHRHHTVRASRTGKPNESYLVVVRSWMLLVMFALMLGLGAVVGTALNNQSAANSPAVAGVQTQAK